MIDKIKGFIKRHKKLFVFACVTVYIALSLVVNTYAADDSSLVTVPDGKSYDGLPDFPIYVSRPSGYVKFHDYILYLDSSSNLYYLICSSSVGGKIYIDSSNQLTSNGTYMYYDSNLSTVLSSFKGGNFNVYYCGLNATNWTYVKSTSCPPVAYADTLLQSSCDIYSDSSCTSVFTRSAVDKLILGMSSSTITKTMMKQIVGLVPLVIGLVICCLAFWKGFRMLRQVLLTA